MSDVQERLSLKDAQFEALLVVSILGPYCTRIEIAGSIRRQKETIGDIEIVCIPATKTAPGTLFTPDGYVRDPEFARAVLRLGTVQKGDPDKGKYCQVVTPKGVKVDVFIVRPDNWGLMFAIRTGSADFSHKTLATGWSKKGYYSRNGTLYTKDGAAVPVPEEADLFNIIGLPFVSPKDRL